jgi:Uma2 family endonuclease
MKAVMAVVPDHILEWRKRTGAYSWDEMWDGVLHMTPIANRVHQDLQGALYAWLLVYWASRTACRVYPPINIASPGGWPNDYRIPDLVLLTPDRFHIDHNEYFEGAPTSVVEVRSPDDETLEKLPFYARLGVPEVWIVDRDTKVRQICVLSAGAYEVQPADADGWLRSAATGVWLRADAANKLAVRLASDASTLRLLPEA